MSQIQDNFESHFFSRSDKASIAELIMDTYVVLISCARKSLENSSDVPEDDLDSAEEYASSIKGSDLSPMCGLFGSVKLGPSSTLSTAWLLTKIRKADANMQGVVSMLLEFRGCCSVIREMRNWLSHDNESGISLDKEVFAASCIVNMFNLASKIHRDAGVDFKHQESKDKYTQKFKQLLAAKSSDERKERGDTVNTPKDEVLLAQREIRKDIQSLDSAVDAISEGQVGLAKSLNQVHNNLAAVMSAIRGIKGYTVANRFEADKDGGVGGKSTVDGREDGPRLSAEDAEDAMIILRNRIYRAMQADHPDFKGYHNLLQRPLINAAINNQCSDLDTFKNLDEYKRRVVNETRYPDGLEDKQLERFGKEIDDLLKCVDYTKLPSSNPDIDLGDDIP